MGVWSGLSRLDAYPKVRNEFRVWTEHGGVVSLTAILVMLVLLLAQVSESFHKEAVEDVVVENGMHETLTIHFDITFPRLSCGSLSMAAVDASGAVQSMTDHAVYKFSLDKNGKATGLVSRQDAEEGTLLSHSEAQKRHEGSAGDSEQVMKHKPQQKSCGSCYGVADAVEPKKCCNTCKDVREAFKFRDWEWDSQREKRFWQCQGHAGHSEETGCEIFGSIFVAKAKGSFHFGASASSLGKDALLVLLGLADSHFDISHTVHNLWFGEERPERGVAALKSIDSGKPAPAPPLSGFSQTLEKPSIVQYYVKVVGNDVVRLDGSTVSTFTYSATEHSRPVSRGSLPSLHFFYDTPPLRLIYVEHVKTWSHLFTNLCALVGGIFTVFGIIDALIYKKKLSSFAKVLRKAKSSK